MDVVQNKAVRKLAAGGRWPFDAFLKSFDHGTLCWWDCDIQERNRHLVSLLRFETALEMALTLRLSSLSIAQGLRYAESYQSRFESVVKADLRSQSENLSASMV